jgi:replicative DNA helicase
MIKRQKIDLSEEKKLITNMIVSTEFLSKIHNLVDPKLFETPYARTLSMWILEFYGYAKEAPGRAIQDVYQKKASMLQDEQKEDMADYLSNLSSEWERHQINNVDYSYKNGTEYLRLRSVNNHIEKIQNAFQKNDPDEAESLIASFKRLERPESTGIDLLRDAELIKEAFEHKDERLFKYRGALGDAIGWICRQDFISINGPAKRGKSWYMMDFGFRAALTGHKVLFISLEMTVHQTVRRWWQAFQGQPAKPGVYRTPRFDCIQDKDIDIVFEQKEFKGVDTSLDAIQDKQLHYRQACGDGEVRLEIFPSGQMTLSDIEREIDNMEFYDNYVPDVIVIDYADILKPEVKGEKRHQLDDIWSRLRGIAQSRNVALVTGSQTGRATVKKDADADTVSEHFGKIAHITQGIFLNQTDDEKEMGIMRIKPSVRRDGVTTSRDICVLQGLHIGRPVLDSRIADEVNIPKSSDGYGF